MATKRGPRRARRVGAPSWQDSAHHYRRGRFETFSSYNAGEVRRGLPPVYGRLRVAIAHLHPFVRVEFSLDGEDFGIQANFIGDLLIKSAARLKRFYWRHRKTNPSAQLVLEASLIMEDGAEKVDEAIPVRAFNVTTMRFEAFVRLGVTDLITVLKKMKKGSPHIVQLVIKEIQIRMYGATE